MKVNALHHLLCSDLIVLVIQVKHQMSYGLHIEIQGLSTPQNSWPPRLLFALRGDYRLQTFRAAAAAIPHIIAVTAKKTTIGSKLKVNHNTEKYGKMNDKPIVTDNLGIEITASRVRPLIVLYCSKVLVKYHKERTDFQNCVLGANHFKYAKKQNKLC